MDGNYGDYTTEVNVNGGIAASCDCPYPGEGCKHVVAVLLDLLDLEEEFIQEPTPEIVAEEPYLSPDEIKSQALEDREKRGQKEKFTVSLGDMFKGDHLLTTPKGRHYQVTLHEPLEGKGHCSCPDFLSNELAICKHLHFLQNHIQDIKPSRGQLEKERFPYVDIFWDAKAGRPRLFHEQTFTDEDELGLLLTEIFDSSGLYRQSDISEFMNHLDKLQVHKRVRVQESVMDKLSSALLDEELAIAATAPLPDSSHFLKISPYPYQQEGIRFALYKKAALIGDEMGLGKTMQAICLGI